MNCVCILVSCKYIYSRFPFPLWGNFTKKEHKSSRMMNGCQMNMFEWKVGRDEPKDRVGYVQYYRNDFGARYAIRRKATWVVGRKRYFPISVAVHRGRAVNWNSFICTRQTLQFFIATWFLILHFYAAHSKYWKSFDQNY